MVLGGGGWSAMEWWKWLMEVLAGTASVALGTWGLRRAGQRRRDATAATAVEDFAKRGKEDREADGAFHDSILRGMEEVLVEDSLHQSLHDSACESLHGSLFDEPRDSRLCSSSFHHATNSLDDSYHSLFSRHTTDISVVTVLHNPHNTKPPPPAAHPEVDPDCSIQCDAHPFPLRPRRRQGASPGAVALIVGMIHGAAGWGSALGVVPAADLRASPGAAPAYLGTLAAMAAVTGGVAAAGYGIVAARLAGGGGRRAYAVASGSALLSVFVGIILLALTAGGTLVRVP